MEGVSHTYYIVRSNYFNDRNSSLLSLFSLPLFLSLSRLLSRTHPFDPLKSNSQRLFLPCFSLSRFSLSNTNTPILALSKSLTQFMTTGVKKNMLPPGLVSNLAQVLQNRNQNQTASEEDDSSVNDAYVAPREAEVDDSKPLILVTNGDGIEAPGLTCLVQALVNQGLYNIYVCAPQSDRSSSGHSVTVGETVAVTYFEMTGATAYGVTGTPVDCVSLAMSGALFSWSKPLLVISGINRGSSCGHQMVYSGVAAGAREALINGVPSISISLNWKKDESQESDFKDAVTVCLPLISAAIRDVEKGDFPKSCFLNVEIPRSPLTNKGFRLTKQSLWRSGPCWQALSANRNPAARYMSNQQSLGLQLAQLGRDASAAGAARRLGTQKKSIEVVESVGVAGKSDPDRKVKYFRMELLDKEQEEEDEVLDVRALESGFVAVTPMSVTSQVASDIQQAASEWMAGALQGEEQ